MKKRVSKYKPWYYSFTKAEKFKSRVRSITGANFSLFTQVSNLLQNTLAGGAGYTDPV